MPLDQVDIEQQEIQMSFLEHLEVLRWHLMRSVIAIAIGAITCGIYGKWIFKHIILGPTQTDFWTFEQLCKLGEKYPALSKICIDNLDFTIKTVKIEEQFLQHMTIALIGGLILAFPYILFEIYRFVKPALKKSEKSYSGFAILISSLLFFTGVLFGYYIITPVSINFLGNYTLADIVEKEFTIKSVVGLITLISLGAGIIFEIPLVVYILAKIGIVSSNGMKKYRRVAIAVILIFSAFITPPDLASQFLLGVPIYMLYEISILVAKRVERKNLEKEAALTTTNNEQD